MDTKNERVMTTEELIDFVNNQKNEFFMLVSFDGFYGIADEVNSDGN